MDQSTPFAPLSRSRRRVTTALLTAVAAVTALCAVTSPAPAADRPNIIYLMTDDQRFDTLGCMGHPFIQTPHIDGLSKQGVTFNNAFVTTAICMTNRACVFTGQYAARHGVIDFRTSFTEAQLADTYPGQLKKAGYYLGFIGKWGVGQPPSGATGGRDPFDYNKGWPGQNKYYHKQPDGSTRHLTEMMGEQAVEFIDLAAAKRKQGQPFCLSFSFKAPHVYDPDKEFMFQYNPKFAKLYEDVTVPPAPLSDPAYFDAWPQFLRESENRVRWGHRFSTPAKYQKNVKDYWRLITGVDEVVGQIVAKLRETGLADSTVIIFTSDHGFYLGDRGFAGKWYAHEESIRIPLIVYDPRLPQAQRGTRRDAIALSIDMAPTMLELAGVTPPDVMQGRSIVPVLKGETPADWQTEFFYEHNFPHRTIPRNEGVRTPRWKYMRYRDSEPLFEELYDLKNDPGETKNLAGNAEHKATLEMMRGKWEQWREKAM